MRVGQILVRLDRFMQTPVKASVSPYSIQLDKQRREMFSKRMSILGDQSGGFGVRLYMRHSGRPSVGLPTVSSIQQGRCTLISFSIFYISSLRLIPNLVPRLQWLRHCESKPRAGSDEPT